MLGHLHGLAIASLFGLVVACARNGSEPVKVNAFGPVRVGMSIPEFTGTSEKGAAISPSTPSGKFYLHVVSDQLPASCLDAECGNEAQSVVNKGGHAIGGSDGKFAKILGVDAKSTQPWKLDPSLVVVTDASGRVTAIWKGAERKHIPRILQEEGL